MSEHVYSREELVAVILPILRKYHASEAVLFGSYARQEATGSSDDTNWSLICDIIFEVLPGFYEDVRDL